jgi:hypothetical protein
VTDEIQKVVTPHGLEKVSTPRGNGRAMSPLSPYALAQPEVNFSYTGSDWMGPLPPIQPIAPREVAGRSWDYTPGYNIATQPRAYEPVSFYALRQLADSYDPVRLIIERRKDQMTRLPWSIRVKHDGLGKRPKASALSAQTRGIMKDVTAFFKHPCHDMSFRSWLRMLLDDVLIIDAPSLYCERDPVGNLVGLNPIDGATIKVIIDERGRTPRAFQWGGQPFVWCGETVNVANFEELGFRITGGLMYPPAYQEVLKGLPAVNYSTFQLLYKPMNLRTRGVYGFSPVEQIVTTIATAMRRATSQLEYFREGNQPDALFTLPETWTPDKIQQFQDYFDNIFAGNLGNRRKMKFVVSGNTNPYIELKEPPLKTEFDEWLIRIVCFAFSYPPAAFVSLSNRSIAEQHERTAEEEGLEPLKQHISELINDVIEREFSDEVEFAFTEENEVDQNKQSIILQRLTDSGILTPNESRDRLGLEPSGDPGASKLGTRTATGRALFGGNDQSSEPH